MGPAEPHRAYADRIAVQAGFAKAFLPSGQFILTAYRRYTTQPGGPLVVYIEGDGQARESWKRVARDPTPRRPVALELALVDPAPSVIYLARPCQFTDLNTARGCHPRYWANRRFSLEVIEAVNAAIEHAMRELRAQGIHLVGFSGGGVLAALIAVRRPDVLSLITVASPLDVSAWVVHHGMTPLAESLDPADEAMRLSSLPQAHLVGARDAIVPPAVVESFLRKLEAPAPVRLEIVAGYEHHCCWSEAWRERVVALRAGLCCL